MLTRSKTLSVKKLLSEPRSDDEGHGVYKKSTEDHAQVDKIQSACKPRTRGQAKLIEK